MTRLSLYRPQKSKDYLYIDRTIYEMFQVGGVDVFVHKYIGPIDPTDPSKALGETTIQDVLFMENRDRKYANDIFRLRGHYQVQDIDFNLSQFGIFLQNDSIFLTVHINNSIDHIGRKLMSGDVIELPNLKDEYDLRDSSQSLKRYYVIEDINRAAEGFSATWWPHLYRLKLKPIVDSQEFKDIFEKPLDEDRYAGVWSPDEKYVPGQIVKHEGQFYEVTAEVEGISPPDTNYYRPIDTDTLQDIMSQSNIAQLINDAIIIEAEKDALLSGYNTAHYYSLARDEYGRPAIFTIEDSGYGDSSLSINRPQPLKSGYNGYLLGDGLPINGGPFGYGLKFPDDAEKNDYYLRTDYLPNKLFRFDGKKWQFIESSVRMTMTNTDDRMTLKSSFINNTDKTYVGKFATDVITNVPDYVPEFGKPTVSFSFVTKECITNIPYDKKFGVEASVIDYKLKVQEFDANGFLAFRIESMLFENDKIMYSVYSEVIDQRQSLSKALRPTADY